MKSDTKPSLEGRHIPFEFPDDINPQWIPNEPELSAMMNGASVIMPYLEPFLIRTVREAAKQIEDPELLSDAGGFMAQEGQHFRTHRRFNDLLKERSYPELVALEEEMVKSYALLSKRSLPTRMAYTAGFETMTMGVTKWLIVNRVKFFCGADTRVVSFILWHMVEETEHKRVAFDMYNALYPSGFKAHWRRVIGVFHGASDVTKFAMRGYKIILKKEGLWPQWRSRLRLASRLFHFVVYVAPFMFRATLPWHDPRSEKDLKWVTDWLDGYAESANDTVPLINTKDPRMPVPFPTTLVAKA